MPGSDPGKSTDNIFLDAYHGIVKSVTEHPVQAAVVTAAAVGAAGAASLYLGLGRNVATQGARFVVEETTGGLTVSPLNRVLANEAAILKLPPMLRRSAIDGAAESLKPLSSGLPINPVNRALAANPDILRVEPMYRRSLIGGLAEISKPIAARQMHQVMTELRYAGLKSR